jgi:DNA-binding NarL/FixJ family response regulator
MRLIIVDDHAGVRKMIRNLVAGPDDAVCECASGYEAVMVAEGFLPDCVTMDVRMPGDIGGFAAVRRLLRAHPGVRIVVVSSFDVPELREAAQSLGAVGYVTKDNLSNLRSLLSSEIPGEPTSTPLPTHTD